MKIHGCDPIVSIGFELTLKFADFAPAVKIVRQVRALLDGNHLSDFAAHQREGAFGTDNTKSHIMLVQHQDTAIQTRFSRVSNHN